MSMVLRALEHDGLVVRASSAPSGRLLPTELTEECRNRLGLASVALGAVERRAQADLAHAEVKQPRLLPTHYRGALERGWVEDQRRSSSARVHEGDSRTPDARDASSVAVAGRSRSDERGDTSGSGAAPDEMHDVNDPMHFDQHSGAYERSRPPYPEALWQRLHERGLLERGLRVLDLGAGTGQATERFAAAGSRITAVEPGPSLARRLRERLPDVEVQTATAEVAVLPGGSFDVAVAATAIHWFDLTMVLPKLHEALVPGGRFAVWRNVYGGPSACTPFRDRIDQIVSRRPRSARRGGTGEFDVTGWKGRLTSNGHFAFEDAGAWRWSVDLSAGQVRELFGTFSDWTEEEAAQAAAAAEDLGGTVTEHYSTWLLLLGRVDR